MGRRSRLTDRVNAYEDWAVALLGLTAVLVALGLGVATFASANGRDLRIDEAAAIQQRLTPDGADDDLVSRIITLQLDESKLLKADVDAPVPGSSASGDPNADLRRIEADLSTVSQQLSGSDQVLLDVDLITRELPIYTGLVATAQTDNRQRLPIATAYLRDASGYLQSYILPRASDIRAVDQNRLATDDAALARKPVSLFVVDGLGITFLAIVQMLFARRSGRTLNPGILLATALVVAMAAWSITESVLAANRLATRAVPPARAATDLTRARDDILRAQLDDQLSLADPGEDCSAKEQSTGTSLHEYAVTCTYAQDALKYLDSRGQISSTLAAALDDDPDSPSRVVLHNVYGLVAQWFDADSHLATLENLTANAGSPSDLAAGHGTARYSTSFDQTFLTDYSQTDATLTLTATASETYPGFLQAYVTDASSEEWVDYHKAIGAAERNLNGLATAGLLMGVLAGVAVAIGVGKRVTEYWFAGRSTP